MTTNTSYLPDEILLEVLAYIVAWNTSEKQATLARFCAVNRYPSLLVFVCLNTDISQAMV